MRISDWSSDVCSSDLEVEASTAWKRLAHLYRISDDVIGGCSAFLKASESTDPPLEEISKMANWLNNASAVIGNMDVLERSTLFKPLAALMEAHLAEASASDLSRLAWLHLHSGEKARALYLAELGLEREAENIHCQRLVTKLTEFD